VKKVIVIPISYFAATIIVLLYPFGAAFPDELTGEAGGGSDEYGDVLNEDEAAGDEGGFDTGTNGTPEVEADTYDESVEPIEGEVEVSGEYDESAEGEEIEAAEGEEYVEEAEEEVEYVHRPKPISPPFFVYDFDFYREHKADYSYSSYGHFFGGGVNILEKYDVTFGFGVRADSRDRLRKLVRLIFESPLWENAYGTAGIEYQFKLDYNPNITWIFGLYQEYDDTWTFDFYDELATYWNQDNFSNAFNFNMAYLMWYEARINFHIGLDTFYIKRYNDYFRRIEWEPGQEGLGLMRFRVGISKKLYEDPYGYWAIKGELGYDTDNVVTGIATTNYYYKLGSRLVFAFNASFSFDSLGYDIEGLFAEFIIRPF
jgi:hypothetical protein